MSRVIGNINKAFKKDIPLTYGGDTAIEVGGLIADLTPRYRHVIMDAYLDLKTNYKGDNQKELKELKEILEKELKEFLGVTSLKEKGFLFDISLIRKFFNHFFITNSIFINFYDKF